MRRRREVGSQSFNNDVTTAKIHSFQKRIKRYISYDDIFPSTAEITYPKGSIDNKVSKMDKTNTYYTYVYREVNASVFTFTLDQLNHYSRYSIKINVCREGINDNCRMPFTF